MNHNHRPSILLSTWRQFRAGEHRHFIAARFGTMLFTACGLEFNEACARAGGRQCRNCRRATTRRAIQPEPKFPDDHTPE